VSDDEKAGNIKAAGAVAGASFLKIPRMIKGRPCDAATVANHGHGMRGGSWALLFFCPGECLLPFFLCLVISLFTLLDLFLKHVLSLWVSLEKFPSLY
jgi:hypothetical protein